MSHSLFFNSVANFVVKSKLFRSFACLVLLSVAAIVAGNANAQTQPPPPILYETSAPITKAGNVDVQCGWKCVFPVCWPTDDHKSYSGQMTLPMGYTFNNASNQTIAVFRDGQSTSWSDGEVSLQVTRSTRNDYITIRKSGGTLYYTGYVFSYVGYCGGHLAWEFSIKATRQALPPSNVKVMPAEEGMEIAWKAETNPNIGTKVLIERSIDKNAWELIGAVKATPTAFKDATVPNNVNACYRFRTCNEKGECSKDYSAPVCATNRRLDIVSAASGKGGEVAVGTELIAKGIELAKDTAEAPDLPLSLGGVTLKVTDVFNTTHDAKLFAVSRNHIRFLLPAGVALGDVIVTATNNDNKVTTKGKTRVVAVAPGLYRVAPDSEWAAGKLLRIRKGGMQQWEPLARYDETTRRYEPVPITFLPSDQMLLLCLEASGVRYRNSLVGVSVSLAGTPAEVFWVGPHPEIAWKDQITLRVPLSLKGTNRDINVAAIVDGKEANLVKVLIQ